MSKAERLLSYSLLSLITAKPVASSSSTSPTSPHLNGEEDDEDENGAAKRRGHVNADGAWCWRENCEGARGSASFIVWVSTQLTGRKTVLG